MNEVKMTPIEALDLCQKALLSIKVPTAYTEEISRPIQNVVKLLEKVKTVFEPIEKNE